MAAAVALGPLHSPAARRVAIRVLMREDAANNPINPAINWVGRSFFPISFLFPSYDLKLETWHSIDRLLNVHYRDFSQRNVIYDHNLTSISLISSQSISHNPPMCVIDIDDIDRRVLFVWAVRRESSDGRSSIGVIGRSSHVGNVRPTPASAGRAPPRPQLRSAVPLLLLPAASLPARGSFHGSAVIALISCHLSISRSVAFHPQKYYIACHLDNSISVPAFSIVCNQLCLTELISVELTHRCPSASSYQNSVLFPPSVLLF